LVESPSPPDIIGGNYYLTSERFLDHRPERYPEVFHGGNGRQAYADVEAVRVLSNGVAGAARLLEEAWTRYGQPVAITEAHLGSTSPDEQLRWVSQVWRDAMALRVKGIDLRAVTIWSLLGAWDWHCLVTRDEGVYESGVFDIRGASPRPTDLANLVHHLANGGTPPAPLLSQPGWWNRRERLLYPAVDEDGIDVSGAEHIGTSSARRHVA